MKIKAGIIGATGYAGAELVRLLTTHPNVEISAISSVSFEGKKLSEVYPSYRCLCDMECKNADEVVEKSDVILQHFHMDFHKSLQQLAIRLEKLLSTLEQISVLRARKNTRNGITVNFLIRNFIKKPFIVYLNFSEIMLRTARLLLTLAAIQQVLRLHLLRLL